MRAGVHRESDVLHRKVVRFVRESFIAAPVERVFAFHESPDALARLTPPFERQEVIEPPRSLSVGTIVRIRMHLGPISMVWVAEHVEYEKNRLFADRQVRGPFKSWLHRHRFEPAAGGTRLVDDIEYELPLGALGALVAARSVEKRLDRVFAFRHAATKAACEG